MLGKRRTLQLDRWHNDFADVLRFREAVRRMPEFDFQFWKQFPHVVEERRTIQLAAIRIELSAREHEPPAGARAGDIAEVTFVAEPMTRAGAEVGAPDREQAALSLVEERIGGRWRGKDALIHAEQEHEAEVGIARAIHCADQNLIERRRNHADGERAQAGFKDRQPVAERERLARERQRQVVQPQVHLFPHRGVNLRPALGGR